MSDDGMLDDISTIAAEEVRDDLAVLGEQLPLPPTNPLLGRGGRSSFAGSRIVSPTFPTHTPAKAGKPPSMLSRTPSLSLGAQSPCRLMSQSIRDEDSEEMDPVTTILGDSVSTLVMGRSSSVLNAKPGRKAVAAGRRVSPHTHTRPHTNQSELAAGSALGEDSRSASGTKRGENSDAGYNGDPWNSSSQRGWQPGSAGSPATAALSPATSGELGHSYATSEEMETSNLSTKFEDSLEAAGPRLHWAVSNTAKLRQFPELAAHVFAKAASGGSRCNHKLRPSQLSVLEATHILDDTLANPLYLRLIPVEGIAEEAAAIVSRWEVISNALYAFFSGVLIEEVASSLLGDRMDFLTSARGLIAAVCHAHCRIPSSDNALSLFIPRKPDDSPQMMSSFVSDSGISTGDTTYGPAWLTSVLCLRVSLLLQAWVALWVVVSDMTYSGGEFSAAAVVSLLLLAGCAGCNALQMAAPRAFGRAAVANSVILSLSAHTSLCREGSVTPDAFLLLWAVACLALPDSFGWRAGYTLARIASSGGFLLLRLADDSLAKPGVATVVLAISPTLFCAAFGEVFRRATAEDLWSLFQAARYEHFYRSVSEGVTHTGCIWCDAISDDARLRGVRKDVAALQQTVASLSHSQAAAQRHHRAGGQDPVGAVQRGLDALLVMIDGSLIPADSATRVSGTSHPTRKGSIASMGPPLSVWGEEMIRKRSLGLMKDHSPPPGTSPVHGRKVVLPPPLEPLSDGPISVDAFGSPVRRISQAQAGGGDPGPGAGGTGELLLHIAGKGSENDTWQYVTSASTLLSTSVLLAVDSDLNVVFWGPRLADCTNLPSEYIVGRSLLTFLHEEAEQVLFEASVSEALSGKAGKPNIYTVRAEHHDTVLLLTFQPSQCVGVTSGGAQLAHRNGGHKPLAIALGRDLGFEHVVSQYSTWLFDLVKTPISAVSKAVSSLRQQTALQVECEPPADTTSQHLARPTAPGSPSGSTASQTEAHAGGRGLGEGRPLPSYSMTATMTVDLVGPDASRLTTPDAALEGASAIDGQSFDVSNSTPSEKGGGGGGGGGGGQAKSHGGVPSREALEAAVHDVVLHTQAAQDVLEKFEPLCANLSHVSFNLWTAVNVRDFLNRIVSQVHDGNFMDLVEASAADFQVDVSIDTNAVSTDMFLDKQRTENTLITLLKHCMCTPGFSSKEDPLDQVDYCANGAEPKRGAAIIVYEVMRSGTSTLVLAVKGKENDEESNMSQSLMTISSHASPNSNARDEDSATELKSRHLRYRRSKRDNDIFDPRDSALGAQLAQVRLAVRQMGGTLSYRNTYQEFHIELPAIPALSYGDDLKQATHPTGASKRTSFTTLIYESSALERRPILQSIWQRGHAATVLHDGQGLPPTLFDIFILDHYSPDTMHLLVEIASRKNPSQVIITHSNKLTESERQIYGSKKVRLLEKPIRLGELRQVLAESERYILDLQKLREMQDALRKTFGKGGCPWTRTKKLGKGAFSEVFKATNLTTRGIMAVKILSLNNKKDGEIMQMVNEIQLLSDHRHDNIIHYFYCERNDEKQELQVFMEYSAGGTLHQFIRDYSHLDGNTTACALFDILSALSYLHSQSVIHRDIKSQNILLTASGMCKLSDFGCAIVVQDEQPPISSFVGTPSYMAPEVINEKEYDFLVDCWSIGVLAYEMLTGQMLWSHVGENWMKIASHIGRLAERAERDGVENPVDLPALDRLVAEEVSFINCCLKVSPRLRWSADHLLLHPFLIGFERSEMFLPQEEHEDEAIDYQLINDNLNNSINSFSSRSSPRGGRKVRAKAQNNASVKSSDSNDSVTSQSTVISLISPSQEVPSDMIVMKKRPTMMAAGSVRKPPVSPGKRRQSEEPTMDEWTVG